MGWIHLDNSDASAKVQHQIDYDVGLEYLDDTSDASAKVPRQADYVWCMKVDQASWQSMGLGLTDHYTSYRLPAPGTFSLFVNLFYFLFLFFSFFFFSSQ